MRCYSRVKRFKTIKPATAKNQNATKNIVPASVPMHYVVNSAPALSA